MHIYDYIIIGSGLTGLTIAKKISQETDNLLVLEASDQIGGDNRNVKISDQVVNNGLRFMPATEASQKAVSFLEDLLKEEIIGQKIENLVETYEASGFKKFVGFGEKSPDFYEQLSYFLQQYEFPLKLQPYEWTGKLAQSLEGKIQRRSIVTKFGFEGLDSEKPKLTHVVVNGTKTIYASNFIYAGPVKDLQFLIPDDVFSARAKAKLKKSKSCQAVCVDLAHSHIIEKTNLHLLNGTTDDDIGPCVGRFIEKPAGAELQVSQWLSFMDSESAEDTENIGLVLKKIKRQIKRAYPEVGDSIKRERIFVSPSLSGADLKLNSNLTFPKVDNLWIASSQGGRFQNLLSSIMQARLALSSLGFIESLVEPSVAEEDINPHFESSNQI
jgi:hypothetical protein